MKSDVGVLVLLSLVLSVTAYTPIFVHLALTGNATSMAASWFSTEKPTAVLVNYGTSSFNLNQQVSGTADTYYSDAGWISQAVLVNLAPCSTYYYSVGQPSSFSTTYSFKTECPITASESWLRIPVFGDMGLTDNDGYSNAKNTLLQLVKLINNTVPVDFYLHVGDISYANDRVSFWYEEVYNDWFQELSKIHPYFPYMVAPGNHDESSGFPTLEYSEKFKLFNRRFRMPWRESNSNALSNMWYSFNYRGVHFISFSTETDYPDCEFYDTFGDQLAWLKQDLAAASANRKQVPWIIAVGHRPIYSSVDQIYIQWFIPPLQRFVEDLFHQYDVDIYFCGHVHSYERTYPVYKGQVMGTYDNPSGLVEIVTGAAGCLEGMTGDYADPSPPWSAYHYDKHTGYGILEVFNSTNLAWTFYRSDDNSVLDYFTMTKQHSVKH